MYGYIYKTTNLANGKIYIGQKQSSKFLGRTYLGSGLLLREAVTKYGRNNFDVELIAEAFSREELNRLEKHYIAVYRACDLSVGYNLSAGGSTPSGLPAWNKGLTSEECPSLRKSESTRQKHSAALQRAYSEGRRKAKQYYDATGVKHTAAQCRADSERQKGKRWMYIGPPDNPQHVLTVFVNDIPTYLERGYQFGRPNFHRTPWNKGLSADTDSRVASYVEKRKELLKTKSVGFCHPKNLSK